MSDDTTPSKEPVERPDWLDERVLVGDCKSLLRSLPAASVHACITDPPYHLTQVSRGGSPRNFVDNPYGRTRLGTDRGFMGMTWDGGDIAFDPELWAEVLRVLKPGGHAAVFAATRTFHRVAVAVEDAGFEVRDCISWVSAQGFPKSRSVYRLDILPQASKAVAAAVGDENVEWGDPGRDGTAVSIELFSKPVTVRRCDDGTYSLPADMAWMEGVGTALKPAHELILLARKPFNVTLGANLVQHGVGALDIDAARVGTAADVPSVKAVRQTDYPQSYDGNGPGWGRSRGGKAGDAVEWEPRGGRWPANFLLAHSEECEVVGSRRVRAHGSVSGDEPSLPTTNVYGEFKERRAFDAYGDGDGWETVEEWDCAPGCPVAAIDQQGGGEDGASRFFPSFPSDDPLDKLDVPFLFCPKAPAAERPVGEDGTRHATVKPLRAMQWLVRLLGGQTGNVILDPFLGSGTTAEAALNEGYTFVGCEISDGTQGRPNYLPLIQQRIDRAQAGLSPGLPDYEQRSREADERRKQEEGGQATLF